MKKLFCTKNKNFYGSKEVELENVKPITEVPLEVQKKINKHKEEQILMLDREMLGATKNVKQFYYEDITSMSTDQKENGEPYRPKSFTRKWAKTLEKYGLRHIKLHGTRHSAISLLLSEGVPIQIVQQRAGHQDPKITLAVYSHVSKDKESLVADTLGEILFVWHENLQADK